MILIQFSTYSSKYYKNNKKVLKIKKIKVEIQMIQAEI